MTDEYLKWVKENKIKNLTRNQAEFVEFLIEHRKITVQIGSFLHLFLSVRDYLRKNPEEIKN